MVTLICNVPAFKDFKKIYPRERFSFKYINGKNYGNLVDHKQYMFDLITERP